MKKFIASILIAATVLAPVSAWAYKIVFDPKNFIQNQIAAVKAISTDLNNIKQTIYQAQQLYTMYQNLKNLNPAVFTQMAKDVAMDIATEQAYELATVAVSEALDDQGDFVTQLQRSYAGSGHGGNMQSYVQTMAKKAAYGDLKARELFDMAAKTGDAVAKTVEKRKKLQEQNASNEGIQQSAQTTNQYLDMLVAQNAEMQRMYAENVKAMAEERAKQSVDDQQSSESMKREQERLKNADESFKNRWGIMKL